MENPYVDYEKFNTQVNNGIDISKDLDNFKELSNLDNAPEIATFVEPSDFKSKTKQQLDFKKWLEDNMTEITGIKTSKIPALKNDVVNYIKSLNIEDDYKTYLINLAQRESNFDPKIVNKEGYKGLFQFGKAALDDIGMSEDEYMSDWKKQIDAAIKYTDLNKSRLSSIIKYYNNKPYNGIKLNTYGILAGAHLGGAGGVQNLFLNNKNPQDSNNTSILDYINYFSTLYK